jgi:chemotaxis protein histidine kinase CheA
MQVTMNMSQVMNNMMVGLARNISQQVVEACASKYGFSSEEAMRELGIVVGVSAKEKSVKAKKVSPAFPLPFNGEHSDVLCQALRQNNGLYTQCQAAKKDGEFCKSCHQLASKSEDGIPEYGTISQRMANDPFDYTDPKGRKPTAYTKVMKKYKLTQEQVLEEAGKFGIQINEAHFVAPEEPKRGRKAAAPKEPKEAKGIKGRPKKTTKVIQIADDDDDLFASLVASANEVDEEDTEIKNAAKEKEKQEKEAKKLALEQEREAKKLALEQEKAAKAEKLAAEKAEKEAKLAADKAEKEAKLAAAKAEKEAKLAKAEQEKAEKAAKLAAEKAEKEAAKVKAHQEKEAKKTKKEPEEEEADVCKKFTFNGTKYLRSLKSGIVYDLEKYMKDPDNMVVLGKWVNDTVIFDKAGDDDELSEDEVDDE